MSAPVSSQVSSATTVQWSTGANFNGFLLLGLVLPTGAAAYVKADRPAAGNTVVARLPLWVVIPIVDGKLDSATRVWQNSSIDPPNTQYSTFWYDTTETLIASGPGSNLITISTEPHVIAVPVLTAPTAGTLAVVPESVVPSTPSQVLIGVYGSKTLTGAINGTTGSDGNPAFTYTSPALPSGHLLWKNGQKMIQGTAYTVSYSAGTVTVTFIAPYIPVTGDLLELQIV